VFILLSLASSLSAQNWDRFRGPNGAGQSDEASIPAEWSEENFLWRRPLAGAGHSSPVVWGDRLFITSADGQSAEQVISAFDAASGRSLWERRLPGGAYAMHEQNSFASSTPALDAERLYCLWRAGDAVTLIAFSHGGEEIWRREVTRSTEKHGFGVSPVLVDGIVCVVDDNETPNSTLTGVDAATGNIRWQVPRPSGTTAFATPCILESPGGKKLLVTASTAAGLCVVDPLTGRTAWQTLERELPQRVVSSPIVAGGLVLVSCGLVGNGLHLIAVRPAEWGNQPSEVYRIKENVPNVPTPVVAGNLLFLWHDRGTVSCHDLTTGEQHWRQRVGGNFNGSPIRVADKLYAVSGEGEVVVLAADRRFRVLARNRLDEPTSATPAVASGRLFVRTESILLCIGTPASASQ
jgi:outer membrane protein assembly factor BamB